MKNVLQILGVFFIGAFFGLVPVVGSAMVWLPLSSLVWTRGEPVTAILMASLCMLLNYASLHAFRHVWFEIHAN